MISSPPAPRMTGRIDRTANGPVVHLAEDLDLAVREPLQRALAALIGEPIVTIDVSAVDYADTTLLNAIVRLIRQRRACGNNLPPRLVGVHPPIRRLFDVTKLDRLVSFHKSV